MSTMAYCELWLVSGGRIAYGGKLCLLCVYDGQVWLSIRFVFKTCILEYKVFISRNALLCNYLLKRASIEAKTI